MSLCCVVMANLKSYAEMGIMATIILIICRMLQGFSSLGEVLGAQLYLIETLRQPNRYISVGIIEISARVGGLFALGVANFSLTTNLNWRLAFWVGSIIAIIGFIARTKLRETNEYTDFQSRMKLKNVSYYEIKYKGRFIKMLQDVKGIKGVVFGYFMMHVAGSVAFYITYIYIAEFMKKHLNMTAEQVLVQNLKISILTLIGTIVVLKYCVKKFHPIKIIKAQIYIFSFFLLFIPYRLSNLSGLIELSFLQFLIFSFVLTPFCSETPYFKHIPINKRFSILAITFGIATALANAAISFSTIPLVNIFGYYAMWIIFVPIILCCHFSLNYLKKLEIKRGSYHNYPHEDPPEEDTAINEDDYDYEDLGDEYEPFKNDCTYKSELMDKLNKFSEETNTKLNTKLIEKAITFAKRWHGTQMRKTGDHPFYWHPLMVAEMVAERYLKTDTVVASILHDTVEDSDCTVELIEEKFNHRIAEIVDRLTKKRFEDGKHIVLTLEQTLDRLTKLDDNEALFIKQMDRQHNLETIGGLKPEKQIKMAEESRDYFVRLIAIIGDKLNIYGKIHLENKMFKSCYDALRKKR
eukprot:GHVR01126460.1.p1 GENE.GHVR01126460.1~~GHVR01126460.1.p1  ORF type:complete len:580 (-),score=54.95 GHVR01126460.1:602-2341(-)